MFLGYASSSVDGYTGDADEDAKENDLAGGLVEDSAEFVVIDGRDDCAEGCTEAEGDRITESDAEIADGEAEGEAACSPEDAPEDGVIDAAGILSISGVQNA